MPGEVPSDVPPAAFGRFRVLHQIGAGSLGPVFRGEDPDSHEPVAIKYLRLNLPPEEALRVTDALRALVGLLPDHPGLTRIIEAGQHAMDPYVVTSLATGESLDVALREYGPATIVDARPRLQRLAEGLDLAASHGVHHGALQPRDILISAQATQLAGIGIAPVLERAGVRRAMRRPYAAPEVVEGGPTSAASDQYALGAVTYEWLFGGRAPRSAESVLDAPALPGVDAEKLAIALMTALAPDPADRFSNCTHFVEAIRGSIIEIPAVPDPVAERFSTATPTALPLPLDTDETVSASALLPDEEINEHAPSSLGLDDLELDVASELPTVPVTPRSEPPSIAPRESRREVAWQGSLGAPTRPAPESSRGGFATSTVVAALVAGMLIGSVGGYVVGALRSAVTESEAPPISADEPVGNTAPPSGRVTDVPVSGPPAAETAREQAPAPAAPPPGAVRPPQTSPPKADVASAGRVETARLFVRSSPAGASVAIDGTPRGTTPIALRELELGTRTVIVTRAGYVPVERRITLTADRPSRSVDVQLTPVATPSPAAPSSRTDPVVTSLVVDSRPAGASVTIDGQPAGTTPLTVASIAPGKHTVRLERPGYRPWEQIVDIKAGERLRVAGSLEVGQEEE